MEGCQEVGVSRLAAPDELRLSSGAQGNPTFVYQIPSPKQAQGSTSFSDHRLHCDCPLGDS